MPPRRSVGPAGAPAAPPGTCRSAHGGPPRSIRTKASFPPPVPARSPSPRVPPDGAPFMALAKGCRLPARLSAKAAGGEAAMAPCGQGTTVRRQDRQAPPVGRPGQVPEHRRKAALSTDGDAARIVLRALSAIRLDVGGKGIRKRQSPFFRDKWEVFATAPGLPRLTWALPAP